MVSCHVTDSCPILQNSVRSHLQQLISLMDLSACLVSSTNAKLGLLFYGKKNAESFGEEDAHEDIRT